MSPLLCVVTFIVFSLLSETIAKKCSHETALFGGKGGLQAYDERGLAKKGDITAIELECSEKFTTSIRLRYGTSWGKTNGWEGDHCVNYWTRGKKVLYELEASEHVEGVTVTYGDYINSVTFKTNKRELPRCGGQGKNRFVICGKRLKTISGRSGCIVDSIKIYMDLC